MLGRRLNAEPRRIKDACIGGSGLGRDASPERDLDAQRDPSGAARRDPGEREGLEDRAELAIPTAPSNFSQTGVGCGADAVAAAFVAVMA